MKVRSEVGSGSGTVRGRRSGGVDGGFVVLQEMPSCAIKIGDVLVKACGASVS